MNKIKKIGNQFGSFFCTTLRKCKANMMISISALASSLVLNTALTHAEEGLESNTSSIDPFLTFVCDWLFKIGGVVFLVGGVQFALAWGREDADGKSRALLAVMTGCMLAGIAKAPDLFGL